MGGARTKVRNHIRAVARYGTEINTFKSIQFTGTQISQIPASLSSHSGKINPEIVSLVNMQIKHKRLLKLQRKYHPKSLLE
jgi:hypothetical protein